MALRVTCVINGSDHADVNGLHVPAVERDLRRLGDGRRFDRVTSPDSICDYRFIAR